MTRTVELLELRLSYCSGEKGFFIFSFVSLLGSPTIFVLPASPPGTLFDELFSAVAAPKMCTIFDLMSIFRSEQNNNKQASLFSSG